MSPTVSGRRYNQQLADEVRKWGQWVKEEAEKELAEFYPKDPDGATPIAYLWARTITCEGPGCGAEVPLMRSFWLAKKSNKSVALKLISKPEEKRVDFEIIQNVKAKAVKPNYCPYPNAPSTYSPLLRGEGLGERSKRQPNAKRKEINNLPSPAYSTKPNRQKHQSTGVKLP